jgi:hypothetical protein
MAFPGSTRPCIKTKQRWWEEMEYPSWSPLSSEEQQFVGDTLERVNNVSAKHTNNVSAWYEKKK